MPSIAEIALAAHEAEERAKGLEAEAAKTRERAEAEQEIVAALRTLGIDIDLADITESESSRAYCVEIPVDADATLVASWSIYGRDRQVALCVRPAEQLYWDLPPGRDTKDPGTGGVYGCYGLEHRRLGGIATLPELGAAIKLIRKAREQWRVKHGVNA